MTRMINKEQWIKKARDVHGDRYNYDLVNYTGWRNQVEIVCRVHGAFWQSAASHLVGKNCWNCAKHKVATRDEFISGAKLKHGDRYCYDKVKYTGAKDKVIITCRIHGDFEQVAAAHTFGKGCQKCGRLQKPELVEAARCGDQDRFTRLLNEQKLKPVSKTSIPKKKEKPVKLSRFKKPDDSKIASLIAVPTNKVRVLSNVKALGVYGRRGVPGSISVYSGLDTNKHLHHFYLSNGERTEITLTELNRFWMKLY